jgi:hypothetical protein
MLDRAMDHGGVHGASILGAVLHLTNLYPSSATARPQATLTHDTCEIDRGVIQRGQRRKSAETPSVVARMSLGVSPSESADLLTDTIVAEHA